MNNLTIDLVTSGNLNVDPAPIDKVIGQDEARKQLAFFVKSHSQETPFPTMLFTGSQGLGKTYMAHKVADALGRDYVEANCKRFKGDKAEDAFVIDFLIREVMRPNPVTVLMDESHVLAPGVTNLLLSLLNPTEEHRNVLTYGRGDIAYDMRNINIIFATTDAHKMFRPLVNRCVEIYFHPYSDEQSLAILEMYLDYILVECDKADLSAACRNRARDAFLLSQNILRYCKMNKTLTLTDAGWNEIKDIMGIHASGLHSSEVKLLKMLAESSPISGHNLAVRLGVNVHNVEKELEIRPRELGFVESGSRGHYITEAGQEYLDGLL